jgi:hypothetical protein
MLKGYFAYEAKTIERKKAQNEWVIVAHNCLDHLNFNVKSAYSYKFSLFKNKRDH